MNKFKQKLFSYFGDNKVLGCVMLICIIITSISWLWNFFIEIRSFYYEYLSEWLRIFQCITTLLFIINLFVVYLNSSKKIKKIFLLSYSVVITLYEMSCWIPYIIDSERLFPQFPVLGIFKTFTVIGINILILLLLNNRIKGIFSIVLFITVNYYFNTLHTARENINIEDIVSYLEINILYVCIATATILLFIPIFKNQCPQCGFKNTKQAKFCGKCGHNLTEKVFSLPFKK